MRTGSSPMLAWWQRALRALAFSTAFALSTAASAGTWTQGRTTPSTGELVSVDATGEAGWPYGHEDLAGDGAAAFTHAEQSIDLRTFYATTDGRRLWVRCYVVDPRAVAPWTMVYVFIDSDRNSATGGSGASPEIDPGLTPNAAIGRGYDHVLGMRGDGNFVTVWTYDAGLRKYTELRASSGWTSSEVGRDVDPILVGSAEHGYVQAMVDLEMVGLTGACEATLFVRSASGTAGDRAVGRPAPCVPASKQSAAPLVVPNVGRMWGIPRAAAVAVVGLCLVGGLAALVRAVARYRSRLGRAPGTPAHFPRRTLQNPRAPRSSIPAEVP